MAQVPVPLVAKAAFGIVKVRYWFWWIGSKKKLYSRYPAAFAGGFLFNLATNSEMVRTASKILLIIVRIEACIKQVFKLCQECQDLWSALKGHYHLNTAVGWKTSQSCLPPSVRWEWNSTCMAIQSVAKRIGLCALSVLRRLDKLLMHSINAYEAFYATNEAVNESLIHVNRKIEQLFENKKNIYLALENHKPAIQRIFSACRFSQPEVKTEAVIASVKSTLDASEDAYRSFQSVSETVGEVGIDLMKRTALAFMTHINMAKYLPEWLVPEPAPIFAARLKGEVPEESFPPIDEITSAKEVKKWNQ